MNPPKPMAPLAPYDRIRRRVEDLAEQFPELGLTFGYIGNLERWGDDRAWYVFTQVHDSRPHQRGRFKYGPFTTDRLEAFAEAVESKRFGAWVEEVLGHTRPTPNEPKNGTGMTP